MISLAQRSRRFHCHLCCRNCMKRQRQQLSEMGPSPIHLWTARAYTRQTAQHYSCCLRRGIQAAWTAVEAHAEPGQLEGELQALAQEVADAVQTRVQKLLAARFAAAHDRVLLWTPQAYSIPCRSSRSGLGLRDTQTLHISTSVLAQDPQEMALYLLALLLSLQIVVLKRLAVCCTPSSFWQVVTNQHGTQPFQ